MKFPQNICAIFWSFLSLGGNIYGNRDLPATTLELQVNASSIYPLSVFGFVYSSLDSQLVSFRQELRIELCLFSTQGNIHTSSWRSTAKYVGLVGLVTAVEMDVFYKDGNIKRERNWHPLIKVWTLPCFAWWFSFPLVQKQGKNLYPSIKYLLKIKIILHVCKFILQLGTHH